MKNLTYILILFVFNTLKAQYTAVPNSNFEGVLIQHGLDDVYDGRVLTANIENETHFYMVDEFISNITGIEDFRSLEVLNIRMNSISSIDLSQMTNLRVFIANRNKFTSLDFSHNPNIEHIECNNQYDINATPEFRLSNLNLSNCYNLVYLDVNNNGNVPIVDVSNRSSLVYLNLGGCLQVSTIDVTGSPLLEYLNVGSINISNLDVTNNPNLKKMHMGGLDITNVDISHNTSLHYLNARYCHLTSLDVSNNTALDTLNISVNELTSLDLSHNIHLKFILADYNHIESMDLRNNPEIIRVNFLQNNLNSFSIRNGTNEQIRDMEVRNNGNLQCVEVDDAYAANNNLYPYNQASWQISQTNVNAYYSDDCGLSVEDNEWGTSNKFLIYPNPVHDVFYIKKDSEKRIQTINIYNQFGALIKSANTTKIDISEFDIGIYFVNIITTDNSSFTNKIIKK